MNDLDLQLLKAIQQDDSAAIRAAVGAGASLEAANYSGFIEPLLLSIVLSKSNALSTLLEFKTSADEGFGFALMFCDSPTVEILIERKKVSQDSIQRGLVFFCSRLRSEAREAFRLSASNYLSHASVDHSDDPDFFRFLRPDVLSSTNAPELVLAERLIQLGAIVGGTGDEQDSPIHKAVNHGDVFLADWLVARGGGVLTSNLLETLVIEAARAGNLDGLDSLLQRGASIQAYSPSGETPLLAAISADENDIVQRLLAAGADVNAHSRDEAQTHSPLTFAVQRRNSAIINQLIAAGAKLNTIDDNGNWPLREAVRSGQPETAKRLLSAGANPNLQDKKGNTLLHKLQHPEEISIWFRSVPRLIEPTHLDCIRLLSTAGMNLNACNAEPQSILASALDGFRTNTVFWEALVEAGASPDISVYRQLWSSHLSDHLAVWLFTIGKGDPNFRYPNDGGTLLEQAISLRKANLAEVLIVAGAEPPKPPEIRLRLLNLAIESKGTNLLRLLITRGFSPNMMREDGRSLLEAATFEGNTYAVRTLLDSGVSVNTMGVDGGSVVHALIESDVSRPGKYLMHGQKSAITLLADRGLDLSLRNRAGKTFFEIAKISPVTARCLSDAIALSSGSDRLPLHEAVRTGNLDELRALLNRGENIMQRDALGRTCLTLALSLGRTEHVKLLLRRNAIISYIAPYPGMLADIDYAFDPKFAHYFHARVLTDQLIWLTEDPMGDIRRFEDGLRTPIPPISWTLSCRERCKGERVIVGDFKMWFMESIRKDNPQRSWFRFVVFPHDAVRGVLDGGSLGRIPLMFDPVFSVRGEATIPACDFNFASSPFYFPAVTVAMPDYSESLVDLRQGASSWQVRPGGQVTLDRSLGPIRLSIPKVEGKHFSVTVEVTQGSGPEASFDSGFELTSRMKCYATLARWRAQRNEANNRLTDSANIDLRMLAALETKTLATAERRLSASAIQARYADHVRGLFIQRSADVAGLNLRLMTVRKLLQEQLLFQAGEIAQLINQVDSISQTAPSELRAQLSSLRAALDAAQSAAKITTQAVEVVQDGLFADVDRIIFEYQGLGLELAQYIPPDQLSAKVPLTQTQREQIAARIARSDVWLPDDTFQGKGNIIRHALGLPSARP